MKLLRLTLFLTFILQSCAILDGYKDNQHSWYDQELSLDEKRQLDSGKILERTIDSPMTQGKLVIMTGDPKKFGRYNFVEVGEWKESYEYSSGDFVKGLATVETTYDNYGNIIARQTKDKQKSDNEFYVKELWTSTMRKIKSDSMLVQSIKYYDNNHRLRMEQSLVVLNHLTKLSDRLKKKVKIDTERIWDEHGIIKKENQYKLDDQIK
jgi:hypothetical protein